MTKKSNKTGKTTSRYSNNMKKKHRHGMRVIKSIARTQKVKNELIKNVNLRDKRKRREKFKRMMNEELPEKLREQWKNKYSKIVNESVPTQGWVYKDIVTSDQEKFVRLFSEKNMVSKGYVLTNLKRYEKRVRTNPLKKQKRILKTRETFSFSNDSIIAYNNRYVQHKINKKNEEINNLRNEITSLKKQMNEIEWIVRIKIGDTYQAKRKSGEFAYEYNRLIKKLNSHKDTSQWKRDN